MITVRQSAADLLSAAGNVSGPAAGVPIQVGEDGTIPLAVIATSMSPVSPFNKPPTSSCRRRRERNRA